jgi:predicted nucleotidyltransferase
LNKIDPKQLADEIIKLTGARSVFLYGSRAREDFYSGSDYEIGVLMEKEKYMHTSEIKKHFDYEGVNIFPFYYEDFVAGKPDTPFQKSIYMREVVGEGKTLSGEEVIEGLKPPPITLLDVIQDVRFNLGYALAATHSYRNGDNGTASLHLAKSVLFGTRDYIIFKIQQFPISYDDILDNSKDVDLGEYKELPEYAFRLRRREEDIDVKKLFQNISYLNKFIEAELLKTFDETGNIVLIK